MTTSDNTLPNTLYLFIDIALDKHCYRVTEIVTTDSYKARQMLPATDRWIPLIGSISTDKLNGRKEYLVKSREEFESIVQRFGCKDADEADAKLNEVLANILKEQNAM